MRVRHVLGAVAVAVLLPGQAHAPAQEATHEVRVDAASPLGPVNRALVGFGWHAGGAPLVGVAPLRPHLVRIDASLQDVSTGAGRPLQLAPLLERVAAVREVGAEPLVILSYLPAWLGEPRAGGRDPTRVAPADLDAWQAVVHDVVHALATARAPATRFEAWNEPDVPIFWQDTPAAWVDTVERSARAIAAVERETGLDLAFVGPATAVPDPVYLTPFLTRFRDPALPLDGVSWHYYGNYPFFGPDGAEFPVTEPVQPVVGRENPVASPAVFGGQIGLMRGLVDAALAGSDRARPPLLLDEWNLSAAGFDTRHDTAEGAAFAAATLVEMQEAGLDAGAFFRANDTRGVPGEHGILTVRGERKPAWWTFALWQLLAPTRVAVQGGSDSDGVWVLASSSDTEERVTVLLASFSPSSPRDRTVDVVLDGLPFVPTMATVRRLDATHPEAGVPEPVALRGRAVRVALPGQSVALLEVDPATLPVTGGDGAGAGVALVATGAGGALVARRRRRR